MSGISDEFGEAAIAAVEANGGKEAEELRWGWIGHRRLAMGGYS